MSEYQYYEFQAVDRPLSDAEMRELRAVSTRAEITPTRLVNVYNWGDFRGDPARWMERYFDAFLYLANRGTREFMLRLPRRLLDPETARRYCRGDPATVKGTDGFTILAFHSDTEDPEDFYDGSEWLASLIPLRSDLAAGDHRLLYLAWLLRVQEEEVEDDEPEPPIPPGLSKLTGGLPARGEVFETCPFNLSTDYVPRVKELHWIFIQVYFTKLYPSTWMPAGLTLRGGASPLPGAGGTGTRKSRRLGGRLSPATSRARS